ncbi:hypothetical protein K435DRAFT_830947 [Dendrothele bispora CBS 962.96]|uniref:Oxo-4-hydroxy-4-carboxy-5-ureidoimidazoline decarboxylase domain-containing protein n=1 Tax=Dendrothele bispora (strain CBS 962.96) TaxID=1314807 RepID=A0A4S8LC27_DENBC|nr:hypothetical protein K435DRAFT_830947 [Dendrothele bispora CBS 962.96]
MSNALHQSPSGPDSALSNALSILFEPSPVLHTKLAPELHPLLQSSSKPVSTYAELIDLAVEHIYTWDQDSQARFISGHPRIGENKNLSKLSAQEQNATPSPGGARVTPPEVLARLAHLNACYEKRYPGLIYIVFVNGRTRAAVAELIESQLGLEHSLSPDSPVLDSIQPVQVGGEEWASELNRAVGDVGLIAKSRLKTMGLN